MLFLLLLIPLGLVEAGIPSPLAQILFLFGLQTLIVEFTSSASITNPPYPPPPFCNHLLTSIMFPHLWKVFGFGLLSLLMVSLSQFLMDKNCDFNIFIEKIL